MTSSNAGPTLARAAPIALALALLAPARVALAQSAHEPTAQALETARTLFKEGKELRARGDLAGALEKLQAAHALGNTPVTGLELARTYVLLGKIAEAREVALYSARIPVAPDETEKSADARVEAAKLADDLGPRIPTLAVKIAGLAPGERAHLVIDGVAVPDAAMGEPQKVDPGHHEIAVRAGEGATAREARAQADVKESEPRELTVTVPPAPPAVPPARLPTPASTPPGERPDQDTSPGHHGGSMPALAKVGFATGIAGGAIGLIAGMTALTKKGQLAQECPQNQCTTDTGGASDLETARTWATVSTVSFVAGGAGALVGLVALLSSGGDHDAAASPPAAGLQVAPWIGAGAAGVHGRF